VGRLGRIAAFAESRDLLAVPVIATLAAMLLTNNNDAPRIIYVVAVLPLALPITLRFGSQVVLRSRIFWGAALYLLAVGIASFLNPDVSEKLFNRHIRTGPMAMYFMVIIAYLASRSRQEFANFFLGCCGLLAISAAINIGAYVATHDFVLAELTNYRLITTLGMPAYNNATNVSATYAVYCAGAMAMVQDDIPPWRRALFLLSATILLIGVVMTQARSAYVAVAVSAVVLAGSLSRRAAILVIGIGILIAVGVALTPYAREFNFRGASHRPEIWADYLAMAAQRPFLGYGMAQIDQTIADGIVVGQPHNLLLSALVTGGIFGAAGMALMLGGSLYWAFRYRASGGQIAPLCMLIAMTTAGMFDYQLLASNPEWPWITFWFPIGIGIGAEVAVRTAKAPQIT
jgi:O-antigen ligase